MVANGTFLPGSVVWVDVSTADPAGTREFYASLFGWTYRTVRDSRRRHYAHALLRGRPVAGIAGAPISDGQPVFWTLYLACANVAYTAKQFVQRGGRVLTTSASVSGKGDVVIGVDPTGGRIGFRRPARSWTFHTHNPGGLIWAELDTRDGRRADEFYAQLFGYHQRQIGDGNQVDYTVWSLGEQTLLGRLQMDDDWHPDIRPHWMLHFAVDPRVGTDGMVDRVLRLGGRVDNDPYDTELGRIARVRDVSGAAFALIDPTVRLHRPVDLPVGAARVDDPYDD